MEIYKVSPLPTGQHMLGGGWIFVKEPATQSTPVLFKARYVARGNRKAKNEFGLTFVPTATFTSLQLLLKIVGLRRWYVNFFDFFAAYINANIEEEIWAGPPGGLTVPPGFGFKLQKALYSTSLYINESKKAIFWLHVDDGIIMAEEPTILTKIKLALGELLKLKWADGCCLIIGVDITAVDRSFDLNQGRLIQSIINATWDDTPLLAKCNLSTLQEHEEVKKQKEYIRAVGALSYVEVGT
ncbi:hypothetical protein O181_127721 [Austropuccinia psidii MF-1]|uniref:Reverse transcriptase Ty1/copia-type domain-containing protein n=1 Tax=Austropuccinia psidii MF-1 TaxID=1389203 RepID=A0A9Q3Q719_9BASI|nr:hypothetical protein [Austropuccinia psidii MF-1]